MNFTNFSISSVRENSSWHNGTSIGSSPSRLSVQVWAAVTSVLSITGASTTGVVSLVVWKVNTGSRFLIINYLLLHFITSTINVPVNIYMTTVKNVLNITPPNICPPFQFLYFSTEHGIDWANLFLTVHRIFAVRFPMKYPFVCSRPVVFAMIIFTWIAAFCPNIPYLFGVGGYFLVSPAGRCGIKVTDQAVVVPLYTTATVLPFGLSVLSAFYLSYVLVRIRFTGHHQIQPNPSSGVQSRVRLAKALLAAVLIDALCIKSWSVVGLYFPLVFVRYPIISLLTRTSVVLAATLAPVMICVMNGDYRHRLMRLGPSSSPNRTNASADRPRIGNSNSRPVS